MLDCDAPSMRSATPREPAQGKLAPCAAGQPEEGRFVLRRVHVRPVRESFAEDVARGLTAPRKALPPKYFYDELGSHLFEAICCLPEYYPTRAEREILEREAGAIAEAVGGPVRVLELGSGSARKTRLLLAALLERQPRLRFLPIDISRSALEESARELLQLFPGLSITACEAGFEDGLAALAPDLADGPERNLALFLGSTIGNFEPDEAAALLARVRGALRPGRRPPPRHGPEEERGGSDPRLRRPPRGDGGLQPEPARPHQPRAPRWRLRPAPFRPPGGL